LDAVTLYNFGEAETDSAVLYNKINEEFRKMELNARLS